MTNQKQVVRLSRFLSLILRHNPGKINLTLDAQGWADVDELLTRMNAKGKRINFTTLEEVVATNNKKRFAFNADRTRIRANQGHSIAIDPGLTAVEPPNLLYHGTATRFVESILETGLEKRNRLHVHLSKNLATALSVGSRHGKPYIFEVRAGEMAREGYAFFESENGVWLTDHVPFRYLERSEESPA